MIEKIRGLKGFARFLFRLVYPISLYILFHFSLSTFLETNMLRLIFLLVWGGLEYFLFLKK